MCTDTTVEEHPLTIAQRLLADRLRRRGFLVHWEPRELGDPYLWAISMEEERLVQVVPVGLVDDDAPVVRSDPDEAAGGPSSLPAGVRVDEGDCTPWIARVPLAGDGRVAGRIEWAELPA